MQVHVDNTVALYQYLGYYPDDMPHHGKCNATKTGAAQYVRTHPQVITRIKTLCKTSQIKSWQMYETMTLTATNELECPRNLV